MVIKTTNAVADMRKRVILEYAEDPEVEEIKGRVHSSESESPSVFDSFLKQIDRLIGALFPQPQIYRMATVVAILLILFIPSYFLFLSLDTHKLYQQK